MEYFSTCEAPPVVPSQVAPCTPSPSRKKKRPASKNIDYYFSSLSTQKIDSECVTPSSLATTKSTTHDQDENDSSSGNLHATTKQLPDDDLESLGSNQPILSPPRKKRSLNGTCPTTQLYLDFGQSNFGKRTICATCGMLFVHGLEEDRINHERVCREYISGVSHPAWKNERVARHFEKDRVVEIRSDDPVKHRRRVRQVKVIVDREMGFVPTAGGGDEASLLGRTAFLYVSNKKIVGFLTAQLIDEAFALCADGSRSKVASRAILGVHQIWCHGSHRHKRIATRLVETARDKMVFGYKVPLDKIAFSSPTADGIKFAKRVLKTDSPLIYLLS